MLCNDLSKIHCLWVRLQAPATNFQNATKPIRVGGVILLCHRLKYYCC